jgi:transcriptional regulator with XRE-family HTH domain
LQASLSCAPSAGLLALHRWARGLSQVELARLTGMSSAHISLIERGDRNPPYLTILKIARAMGKRTRVLIPHGGRGGNSKTLKS